LKIATKTLNSRESTDKSYTYRSSRLERLENGNQAVSWLAQIRLEDGRWESGSAVSSLTVVCSETVGRSSIIFYAF